MITRDVLGLFPGYHPHTKKFSNSRYENAGHLDFIPSHRSHSRSCFTHYPARKPLSQRDLSRYDGVLDLGKSVFEQTHQCSARFLPQLRSRNGAFLQNASIALVAAHQVPWFPFLGRHNSIREPQRYVKTALGTCIAAVRVFRRGCSTIKLLGHLCGGVVDFNLARQATLERRSLLVKIGQAQQRW